LAEGIHTFDDLKLGKGEPKTDKKTIVLTDFVDSTVQVPVSFNFDKHRRPFPAKEWGNDEYGDCVDAGQANQLLRLERVETRRTIKLTNDDVIRRYKQQTGTQFPGDEHDNGLIMLDTLREWRAGWKFDGRVYKIAAFGKVPLHNPQLLRLCCFLFNGLQLGFDLPLSARTDTRNGVWVTTTGEGSTPGSWGGHAVYTKRFDANNIYVLSWGDEIRVSNEFMEKYADEVWAVIDDFDPWRHTHGVLDVEKLINQMKSNGISISS